jgi:GR25 family glycosyltransferase involved in LPS biosynthesis
MDYTIISLNDERVEYKTNIRRVLENHHEHLIDAVNGSEVDLDFELASRGLERKHWGNAKRGELGVWLSNFDRWLYVSQLDGPMIVFEDDAIPDHFFDEKLESVVKEVPEDFDIITLWVPENQRQDYYYDVKYNENGHPQINGVRPPEYSYYRIDGAAYAALVYQGYGMVSLMYSPKGGERLVELAREYGITGPVDCWIYEQAHMGHLNGYAPRPEQASIVHYDWKATSHVQHTEMEL